MTEILRWTFPAIAIATWLAVPLYAGLRRGRFYAIFSFVLLSISSIGGLIVHARLPEWVGGPALSMLDAAFAYGMAATAAHYALLVRARLRGRLYRGLISLPGQVFLASTFMSTFWLLGLSLIRLPLWLLGAQSILAWLTPLDLLPYVVGIVAAFTSPRPLEEVVRLQLGETRPASFSRLPMRRYRRSRPEELGIRPLRVVQLSDTHLGPWQSVSRLKRIVTNLLDHEPDLVLLTGDFLTMESNDTPGALAEALSPLAELPQRCFAIFGNHDHEAPEEVRSGLAANGIRLLVDDACTVGTEAGPVQLIGADYVRKDRDQHLESLLEEYPRLPEHRRILLLHDPSAFHDLPKDDVDLVLSGHTHGGQVGLLSLGLNWTVLSRSRWPDHGHFAHGTSHLYVHRGTGFYGFPLRIGVPGEASLLELIWKN